MLVAPPGERAPGSVPVEDVWVDGPAAGPRPGPRRPARRARCPTVFSLHGGPHAADEDRFAPARAAWVDAGFAVVEVNYRGSTGYGSAWRDAIEGRPGLTELEDVAAVATTARSPPGSPTRRGCVVDGLVVGRLPDAARRSARSRSAGRRASPASRSPTTSPPTRTRWSSCGRSTGRCSAARPEELPELYRAASPLTYVDAVRAPVLVLAGENDPRCPIRQIDNYLDALAARDADYEVNRFDAGHGSLVVEQSMAHMATEVAFARGRLR